jgi:hypothetical protein
MRITDFPELVLPLGTDVLVGVDVVNDITKKIKLENLPVSIPTTAALNAKQNVLVSGTTIKTLNSISLLGSGDIVLTANASGVAGAVQFSNGSAFSSDASNLFWDNTDKRLGVGTNITTVGSPTIDQLTQRLYLNASTGQYAHYIGSTVNAITGDTSLALFGLGVLSGGYSGGIRLFTSNISVTPVLAMIVDRNQNVGIGLTNSTNLTASARLHVIGSGSTSATTSLLVQNSVGTELIKVTDNGNLSTIDIFARIIYAKESTLELRGNSSGSASSVSLTSFVSGLGWLNMFTAESGKDFGQIPRGAVVNGTTIDASAIFQVNSTTKGFLPPRMTTTQRDAIVSPATGLRIYNTTTNTNDTYNGTVWQSNSVSGVSGAIQFSNGSAFASDAANLFWDDTNNRLGVGTNAPTSALDVNGTADGVTAIRFKSQYSVFGTLWSDNTQVGICRNFRGTGGNACLSLGAVGVGVRTGGDHTAVATLDIKGSGSTSATTSLLVQNSAGTQSLKIADDLGFQIGALAAAGAGQSIRTDNGGGGVNGGINTNFNNGATWIDDTNTRAMHIAYNGGVLFPNTTRYPITIGSATKAVASAQLEMVSTTQGFLPPRMTTTQKNAIASPAAGLVVYDSTTNKLCCYNGSTWNDLF